jgi:anti-sigma regulatory factor (Ser/Thr protein kinase)
MTDAVLNGERAAEAAASFTVEGGPAVAADARAVVRRLGPRLGASVTAEIVLLVSELVTNAYRHSGAADQPIRVAVWIEDDRIHCEVADQGPGFPPQPVPAAERGEGGWGLHILDQLADRWGVRAGPPTHVWFELQRA